MRYLLYISVVLIVVSLLYYFGVFDGQKQQSSNSQQTERQVNVAPQKQWETKTDEQPPVTIKITPVELGEDVSIWRFSVVFDAHSGSLDQDPTKVALLSDDKGNIYQPSAWEGPGPGGHHREGVLVFDAISNPTPAYVELNIKDVGGIPERAFKWNIQ